MDSEYSVGFWMQYTPQQTTGVSVSFLENENSGVCEISHIYDRVAQQILVVASILSLISVVGLLCAVAVRPGMKDERSWKMTERLSCSYRHGIRGARRIVSCSSGLTLLRTSFPS